MALEAFRVQRRAKQYAQIGQQQQQQAEWSPDEEKSTHADTPLGLSFAASSKDDTDNARPLHSVVELQTAAIERSTVTAAPLPSSAVPAPADAVEECLQVAETVGLQYSIQRELVYYAVALLTAGLSSLLALWFAVPSFLLRYRRCSLDVADFVLVHTTNGQSELCAVEPIAAAPASEAAELFGRYYKPQRPPLPPEDRMILFRHTRYVFDAPSRAFIRVVAPATLPCSHIATVMTDGLSATAASSSLSLYGGNELRIAVPSVPSLLVHEVLHPFFVFQIFSLVLWCFEAYFYFAGCIFLIATVSIATTVIETRRRLIAVADLARFSTPVTVLREGKWRAVPSTSLVPGDVIQVGTGVLPCDIALLSGSCVVNESMLTGESLPVLKSPLDLANKPATHHVNLISASHTLFSATCVLQVKPAHPHSHPLGLVSRTGWSTTKGSLILSILYPTPSTFRFVQQSFKFIGCLLLLSLLGFFISVYQLERLGAGAGLIVVRALDLVTIIVPPSLPLALSVGTNYALVALRRMQVCCISPNRINMAGKVRVMCFDKTGQSRHTQPIGDEVIGSSKTAP